MAGTFPVVIPALGHFDRKLRLLDKRQVSRFKIPMNVHFQGN